MAMSWTTIEGDELERLKRHVDAGLCTMSRSLNAWRSELPFYRNGCLLRVENEVGSGHAVETEGLLIPMDGSSARIYVANEKAGLSLELKNVIAYAAFFSGLLQGSDGNTFPFVTERGAWWLDNGCMLKDLTPRIEISRNRSSVFRVRAYVRHAEVLFEALLEVKPNGEVTMSEDRFIGRFVPMH
jgi:hypothetical protein